MLDRHRDLLRGRWPDGVLLRRDAAQPEDGRLLEPVLRHDGFRRAPGDAQALRPVRHGVFEDLERLARIPLEDGVRVPPV